MRSKMAEGVRGHRAVAAMAMPDDLWQLMQDVSGDWEDLNPRQRAEFARQFSCRVAEQAMAMRQYRAQREALAAMFPDGMPKPDLAATHVHDVVYSWDAGGDRSKPSGVQAGRGSGAVACPDIRAAIRRALEK